MMWQCCYVLLLATVCLAQQRQHVQPGSTGERQIRLEDIERDNLAANQKTSPTPSQQQPTHQQQTLSQQQLAAYQQQLLLQQLQQQYFAPTPIAYSNFGGVPLMIIPTNQLGVGNPAGVPIQAYFVPAEPQFLPNYQPQVYQQPYQPLRYQQPQRVQSIQRLQPVSQDLTYNTIQAQPNAQQTYRQPHNFPSSSIVYAGNPQTSSFQQPQAYHQQPNQQQLYNAYNAIYQQRQEKNSFAAGVKSTPTPPLKPQSPVYSQQPSSSVYSNYKTFNYNQ